MTIAVDGGLFSIGDGHAIQGDGEAAGPALECPMEVVEVEFHLHPDLHIAFPRANTPAGIITFAFDQNLNEATLIGLNGMLDWMSELLAINRKEALALSSLLVDLRVTQIVNGVRGVHAILPYEVIDGVWHP